MTVAEPTLPWHPPVHIDPVTQQDVPDDPAALAASIDWLSARLVARNLPAEEEREIRARLGSELRVARRLDEALAVMTAEVALDAFDQGRWADAADLFATALSIRERIGAPEDQVVSSRNALAAAQERMGE
jgi:hypothetical protein